MAERFLDFSGKVVLITGGTRGIGLETALLFAARGARCILTYRWGEHDEAELEARFQAVHGHPPLLLQADVARAEDAQECLDQVKARFGAVDIFISNAAAASLVKTFDDYTLKALHQSVSRCAWPMVEYTERIRSTFGSYPRYVVGVSSTGPSHYNPSYDFVAASKIVMEVLGRDLDARLAPHGGAAFVVRGHSIRTKLFEDTFGTVLTEGAERWFPLIKAEELAGTILGLCSGYCDAVAGQVITADKGNLFSDNFLTFYLNWLNREGARP